jgi:hypothetical protein
MLTKPWLVVGIIVLVIFVFVFTSARLTTLTFETLDESAPESDAAITISDPQLYARETLINDRRREYDFLTDLLNDSANPEKVQFPSQLSRDLGLISQVGARAGVAIKGSIPPSDQSPSGSDTAKEPASSTRSPDQQTPPSRPQYSPQEEFRDRQAYRAELRAALASVNLDDLHDFAGNALFRLQFKAAVLPGETKNKFGVARLTLVPTKITPDELKALYFSWLGHISSRINIFNSEGVLVVDRRYEDSGIAPHLAEFVSLSTDLDMLDQKENICLDARQIFRVCSTFAIATASGAGQHLKSVFQDRWDNRLTSIYESFIGEPSYYRNIICSDPLKRSEFLQTLRVAQALLQVLPSVRAALDGVAIQNASTELSGSENTRSDNFVDLRGQYRKLGQAASRLRNHIQGLETPATVLISLLRPGTADRLACAQEIMDALPIDIRASALTDSTRTLDVPDSFRNALTKNRVAQGRAYGFGTTPSEMGQRFTTTARTTASLDLSLALQSSGEVASANSAVGFARKAAQAASAMERVPLVVGFSDRHRVGDEIVPQFGWLFGPRLRYDAGASRYIYEQAVSSYDVSADVSVPSWWPRIELSVETAWVKNWHGTAQVLPTIGDRSRNSSSSGHKHIGYLSIPMPLNRADLDGLTKFLTQRSLGGSQEFTSIRFVEPTAISACATDVTFLIYGANIWRSAEVFFGGMNSKDVKVLPDMDGIAARFPLGALLETRNAAKSPFGYNEVALRVNTRNGNDWRPIKIVGSRLPKAEGSQKSAPLDCEAPYNVPTPIIRQQIKEAPIVYEMTPLRLFDCSAPAMFIFSGRHLLKVNQELPEFYFGGKLGKAKLVGSGREGFGALQVLSVSFDDPPGRTNSETQTIPIVVANEGGFVSVAIDVSACQVSQAAKASKS